MGFRLVIKNLILELSLYALSKQEVAKFDSFSLLILSAYPNNPVRYFSVRQRIVNRFVLRECFSCVPFPYKG